LAGGDPVSGWLARLPEAQRLSAHAATDARLLGWALGLATFVIACGVVSRADLMGRLRAAVETAKPRPWLTSALSAGVLALILALANVPIDAFASWRIDLAHGVAGGGLFAHLGQGAAAVLPSVVEGVVLAPPLYWLMRRAPRAWPWIAGGAFAVVILAAGWLPYALASGPALAAAPAGAVRDGVARLIAEAGLPTRTILASPDPSFDADVAGAFGRAKVVLGPQLLAAPPAEARAWVGHLMSHYVHDDLLVVVLIYGACGLLAMLAVQRFAAPLTRLLAARDARSSADPETMPAASAILALALVAATLAGNDYLRWANFRADQYSLDHAREPDGLVAAMERFWDHASVDPNPLEEALFYAHPPLSQRLAHVAAWKATHQPGNAGL
jgi:STE24 endopeptidase